MALNEAAPVFDNLPAAVKDETPRNMEAYDQGYGCILYRTKIPAGAATTLEAAAIHDFGYVFLDGKRVGILDRRSASAKILLPERDAEAQLDILVEPMGRINFGPEMADRKGLIAPVKLGGKVLNGWEIFRLPLDDKMLAGSEVYRRQTGFKCAGILARHLQSRETRRHVFGFAQLGQGRFVDERSLPRALLEHRADADGLCARAAGCERAKMKSSFWI